MATTTGIRAGASASDGRLALVAETAWGTTPATPAFKSMRFTSENIQPAKNTVRSNETRADRNVVDEILVGRNVSGDLSFELSYGVFDDLFEGLMFSEWSGDDSEILKNGAGIGRSFTAERKVLLPGGTSDYQRFTGLVVNTMNLQAQAGQIVTGSFGLMGKFGGRGTAAIAGATYADAPQHRVLNATSHFGGLTVGGIVGMAPIRSINMQVTNNIRAQEAVGNLDAVGFAPGRFEVTGSVEAYFKDGNVLQAFLDHTDLSLEFVLGVAVDEQYKFTLPTIVLTGSPGGNLGGNDQDVMQTLSFTAVLDRLTSPAPIGCAMKIEKVLSP